MKQNGIRLIKQLLQALAHRATGEICSSANEALKVCDEIDTIFEQIMNSHLGHWSENYKGEIVCIFCGGIDEHTDDCATKRIGRIQSGLSLYSSENPFLKDGLEGPGISELLSP